MSGGTPERRAPPNSEGAALVAAASRVRFAFRALLPPVRDQPRNRIPLPVNWIGAHRAGPGSRADFHPAAGVSPEQA